MIVIAQVMSQFEVVEYDGLVALCLSTDNLRAIYNVHTKKSLTAKG